MHGMDEVLDNGGEERVLQIGHKETELQTYSSINVLVDGYDRLLLSCSGTTADGAIAKRSNRCSSRRMLQNSIEVRKKLGRTKWSRLSFHLTLQYNTGSGK